MKVLLGTALIILLISFETAAQAGSPRWFKFVSPKNDASFQLPHPYLIDNEKTQFSALYRAKNITLRVNVNLDSSWAPKDRLTIYRRSRKPGGPEKYNTFTNGDFEGDFVVTDEEMYSITLYLASKFAFYTISASAPTSSDGTLVRFLSSIRLGDKPLSKRNTVVDDGVPEVQLVDLKSSSEVVLALERKEPSKVPVEYVPAATSSETTENSKADYSLPLLVLRQQKAHYTDEARIRSVDAVVKLRIKLGANGVVESIIVVGKQDLYGLTNEAIKAARQIKFLPPEIDGKPVATEIRRDYTFDIH